MAHSEGWDGTQGEGGWIPGGVDTGSTCTLRVDVTFLHALPISR